MYHSTAFKRSVLTAAPILSTSAQQFHIATKLLVRRILSKSAINNSEPEHLKNEPDSSITSQNCSPDFLGIESDDGVITVSTKNLPISTIQKPKKREKFYSTSYGVVRYDSDNKLKFHGQYGKKYDFGFPHISNDYEEVSRNLQNLSQKSLNSSKTLSKNLNETYDSNMLEKEEHDDSYIDKYYFSVSQREKSAHDSSYIHKSTEELNFVDENYFASLKTTENLNSQNIISEERKEDTFIETVHHDDKSSNILQSELQEFNLFDKNYFEDISVTPESIKMQDFSQAAAFKKHKITDYNKTENFKLNVNESAVNLKPSSDIDISNKSMVGNDNILQEFIEDMSFKPAVPSDKKYQSGYQKEIDQINKFVNNKQKLDEPMLQDSKISSMPNDRLMENLISKGKNELPAKNIVSDMEINESSLKKNDFKHSLPSSKESVLQNNEGTAHEFVTKLRNTQEITQQTIRKVRDSTTEKFDSKGFRILKNQVADLTYFTRDEILDALTKNIVYSDDDLLVLNKPYGLVIHDSETTKEPCLSTFLEDLAKEMDRKNSNPKLFTVHRIDKETTGCLLLARNETMALHLRSLFAYRKIIKKYWILTTRVPDPPEGIIDIPISEGSVDNRKRMVLHPKLPTDMKYRNHSSKGREAITSYKVLSESGNAALVEACPKTGVKHQIRVHFGFGLSCPILGDHKYSYVDKLVPQKLSGDILTKLHVRQSKVRHIPMHIHARTIIIPNYFEQRNLFVNAPLPEHMKNNLKNLKFRKKYMSHGLDF